MSILTDYILPITGPAPFLLDGAEAVENNGRPIFMTDFEDTPEQNFSIDQVLDGRKKIVHRLTDRNGVTGPTGFNLYNWSMNGVTDSKGFRLLRRVATRSSNHTITTRLRDYMWFDGDGTTTAFDLTFRHILGNEYGQNVAEDGVNAGVGPTFAQDITIYNRVTQTTYTIVWDTPPTVATEVRVNSTGADAFRTLTFHTAPGNSVDAFVVFGEFLYTVGFHVTRYGFRADINGQIEVPFGAQIWEIGAAA